MTCRRDQFCRCRECKPPLVGEAADTLLHFRLTCAVAAFVVALVVIVP